MLLDVANISEKFNPLSRVATTSQTTDNRKKQGRYWGWSSWGEGQQAPATTPTYPSWGVWGNAVSSPPELLGVFYCSLNMWAFGGILLLTKHVQTTPRPKFSVTGEGGQQQKIGPTWKIWHNLTTDLKIKFQTIFSLHNPNPDTDKMFRSHSPTSVKLGVGLWSGILRTDWAVINSPIKDLTVNFVPLSLPQQILADRRLSTPRHWSLVVLKDLALAWSLLSLSTSL